jgi:hypothetical protein
LSVCPSVRPFVHFAFCRIDRMLMKVACNTQDRVLCGALPRHLDSVDINWARAVLTLGGYQSAISRV